MFIQLTVVLSLLVQVCSQSPYDTSFGKVVPITGGTSQFLSSDMFPNGDLLAAGWTQGLVGFPTSGDYDYLLQRYKADGSLVWTKVFNSNTGHDTINAVKLGSDDSVYAVGHTSAGAFDGHPLVAREDASFAKFDSAGNKIFTGMFGGDQNDRATGVAVDEARGVFYIVGQTGSATLNGVPAINAYDGFLVTVSSATGAILSTKRFNGDAGSTNLSGAAMDSTGALWMCGTTGSPTYFTKTSLGGDDIILQKVSPSGESLFVSRVGRHSRDTADFLALDTSDNLYTLGSSLSGPYNGETGQGRTEILVTKNSNAGVALWARTYGGGDWDSPGGISVNSEHNRVYVTGNTQGGIEGAASPGGSGIEGQPGTPFLLVLDATTGVRLFVQTYVTGTARSSGGGIVSRGYNTYMTGYTMGNMFGQTNSGVAPFVLGLKGDLIPPTPVPTAAPSYVPTASPTAVCMQWALGDYGESCSTTCSKLSRTCKDKYLKEIVNQESFYAIVGSAVSVRSGGYVGTAENFCSQTTDSAVKVGGPAALSIVLSSEDHHLPVRTSCTYPTSTADATLGCDAVLPLHNYRRFCPCVDHNCDGAWYLGYSGDSCDATCTSAGGVCDAEPLNDIANPDAFSAMVASATVVETNEIIGESSAAYCHEGINILPLAPAPSVITLTFGAVNETLCAYPTSVSNLQGSCDMAFTDLPAQRFCNCKVTGPASHPHRMLLAAVAAEPAAVQPQIAMAVPTPRLRGKAFEV